ncbi:MAG: hypothetical protein ACYDFT_06760 [Thermoplasmata archaeon]
MATKSSVEVSFLQGKKTSPRIRVNAGSSKTTASKVVSFLKGEKTPQKTSVTLAIRKNASARRR